MRNLLSYIDVSAVKKEPFPYFVVHNVLPQDIYDRLVASFPSVETIVKGAPLGSNKRFDYRISDVRENKNIDPIWREFVESNSSKEAFDDLLRLFGKEIESRFPSLKERFGSLSNIKTGIRFIDNHQNKDLLFDTHIAINTPVIQKPNSVRGPHLDDPKKLFGGLFYMRLPEDKDSQGGELLIYKYKDKDNKKFLSQAIDEKYVQEIEKIPYKANTLVVFLNTIDSLHGVTPRQMTAFPRLFVNLVAELEKPLFDLSSLQESKMKLRFKAWSNRLMGKGGKLG